MSNRERAAEHAAQAEKMLAQRAEQPNKDAARGALATAHATLALYYQREADRTGEA
jgi:hypothetical protein